MLLLSAGFCPASFQKDARDFVRDLVRAVGGSAATYDRALSANELREAHLLGDYAIEAAARFKRENGLRYFTSTHAEYADPSAGIDAWRDHSYEAFKKDYKDPGSVFYANQFGRFGSLDPINDVVKNDSGGIVDFSVFSREIEYALNEPQNPAILDFSSTAFDLWGAPGFVKGIGHLGIWGVSKATVGIVQAVKTANFANLTKVMPKTTGSGVEAANTGLRRSTVLSPERAHGLLTKYGRSADQATDYINSFDGPITARIVAPGESFLRYTDVANSKGSFLTNVRFSNSASAVDGLYLGPYGNGASLLQPVSASGRSIILEGRIANGGRGVTQSLIIDRGAFTFGTGAGF